MVLKCTLGMKLTISLKAFTFLRSTETRTDHRLTMVGTLVWVLYEIQASTEHSNHICYTQTELGPYRGTLWWFLPYSDISVHQNSFTVQYKWSWCLLWRKSKCQREERNPWQDKVSTKACTIPLMCKPVASTLCPFHFFSCALPLPTTQCKAKRRKDTATCSSPFKHKILYHLRLYDLKKFCTRVLRVFSQQQGPMPGWRT